MHNDELDSVPRTVQYLAGLLEGGILQTAAVPLQYLVTCFHVQFDRSKIDMNPGQFDDYAAYPFEELHR